MDSVKTAELLVPYEYYFYSLATILIIYVIKEIYKLIFKRDISIARQKDPYSYTKEYEEKLKELSQLKKHMKPEYYFKDDYYKFLPKFEYSFPNEFEQFGQYVSLELKCLKFEQNKEKLKNEIRKIIVRIAEEDANNLLSDTPAKELDQNHVVK